MSGKVVLVGLFLVAAVYGQCANFTRIYTFEEFDIDSFVTFKQRVPASITFRRGWEGMSSQLRLTMNAATLDAAKGYLFQIIGGEVYADSRAAITLEVVPPTEDDETNDASTLNSFLGTGLRTAATMALLSGQFVGEVLADTMTRQTCRVSADVQVLMAPYYYDYLMAAISSGQLTVQADSYRFENNTGTLDRDVCLDTNVQATYFQSCDQILTSLGLGLSSESNLQLTDAFLYYDGVNSPHQDCSFDQMKDTLQKLGDDSLLIAFSCEFLNQASTGSYCGGVTFSTFKFQTFATQLQQANNTANFATRFDAVVKLQARLEKLSSDKYNPWADFVDHWNLDRVCRNWDIDEKNCNGLNKGCDPEGDFCCGADGVCVAAEPGQCKGKDWTNPWNYVADESVSLEARDLQERATTLSGPACAKNHPLIGKPGVCIEKSACAAKKGQSVKGLCPAYGATILCCAGRGFSYNYQSAAGLCGPYAGKATFKISGNGGKTYTVVKILKEHLVDTSAYNAAPTARDNTMTTTTACAFSKLRAAALKSGVSIKINSGFRTLARQNYFWHCYQCKCCNNGNLAARPGTSNHGRGIALDLNTASGGVYNWLTKNGRKYGFVRTVPSEKWHWEYRP